MSKLHTSIKEILIQSMCIAISKQKMDHAKNTLFAYFDCSNLNISFPSPTGAMYDNDEYEDIMKHFDEPTLNSKYYFPIFYDEQYDRVKDTELYANVKGYADKFNYQTEHLNKLYGEELTTLKNITNFSMVYYLNNNFFQESILNRLTKKIDKITKLMDDLPEKLEDALDEYIKLQLNDHQIAPIVSLFGNDVFDTQVELWKQKMKEEQIKKYNSAKSDFEAHLISLNRMRAIVQTALDELTPYCIPKDLINQLKHSNDIICNKNKINTTKKVLARWLPFIQKISNDTQLTNLLGHIVRIHELDMENLIFDIILPLYDNKMPNIPKLQEDLFRYENSENVCSDFAGKLLSDDALDVDSILSDNSDTTNEFIALITE